MELDRVFLKKLWNGKKVICPNCKEDYLILLHKKDNDDYRCPKCKKVYRTINILNDLLNSNEVKK